MLAIKRQFFLLILSALAISCAEIRQRKAAEWSAVAVVDGGDTVVQDLVRSTLKKHHIVCFMEGSLGYAVMVPKDHAKEAKDVLRQSPELTGRLIKIVPDATTPDSKISEGGP